MESFAFLYLEGSQLKKIRYKRENEDNIKAIFDEAGIKKYWCIPANLEDFKELESNLEFFQSGDSAKIDEILRNLPDYEKYCGCNPTPEKKPIPQPIKKLPVEEENKEKENFFDFGQDQEELEEESEEDDNDTLRPGF